MFGSTLPGLVLMSLISSYCSGLHLQAAANMSGPATPYRLTYTPVHVATHVTRPVTLRCDDNALVPSRVGDVNRIRMLKKMSGGWMLVAELRDNEDKPTKTMNVTVSARIGLGVANTFLEIIWDVALRETYGTYICEVIGFDKDTQSSLTELTSEVTIVEEDVTARDLWGLIQDLTKKVAGIDDKTNRFGKDFSGTVDDVLGLNNDIALMKKDIGGLLFRINETSESVTSLSEHVEEVDNDGHSTGKTVRQLEEEMNFVHANITSNSNTTRLLHEDMTNIRNDLTAYHGDMKALEKADESFTQEMNTLEARLGILSGKILSQRDVQKTVDATLTSRRVGTFEKFVENFAKISAWPAGKFAIPATNRDGCPLDRQFFGNNHMYLHSPGWQYHLCETTRVISYKRPWPEGRYCVNKVMGFRCPNGLEYGKVEMYVADTKVLRKEFVSSSFVFCCKTSGSHNVPMVLPTHSPFKLYRYGGRCQKVRGMETSEQFLGPIKIKHSIPSDVKTGVTPDVDISSGSPIKFRTCYYY
ncbi:apextrin-like protein [Elysia marginata]|uniref:Apextrin-like protein n=1 Tax=Elysia marginata TaxID=1093978 RepID=A0AAV4HHX3_9GAST|nr:apextrin-like protein [Elysia marginata]